jgi:hypothetical protein
LRVSDLVSLVCCFFQLDKIIVFAKSGLVLWSKTFEPLKVAWPFLCPPASREAAATPRIVASSAKVVASAAKFLARLSRHVIALTALAACPHLTYCTIV